MGTKEFPKVRACGTPFEATKYIPCPDLIGVSDWNFVALTEARRYVKYPLRYIRAQVSQGRCAFVWRNEDKVLLITKRLTVVLGTTDWCICGMYKTNVDLVM